MTSQAKLMSLSKVIPDPLAWFAVNLVWRRFVITVACPLLPAIASVSTGVAGDELQRE